MNPGTLPRSKAVSVDLRVLVLTAAVAFATAVLFGLLPALQGHRGRCRYEALWSRSADTTGAVHAGQRGAFCDAAGAHGCADPRRRPDRTLADSARGCLASVAGSAGSDGSEHGRIAGTWRYNKKGKFIDVTVEAFAKMPKRDVKQLSRFAERVAEYFALGLRNFELR
jgi:hypothetical protein